jgi:hypothetical protein
LPPRCLTRQCKQRAGARLRGRELRVLFLDRFLHTVTFVEFHNLIVMPGFAPSVTKIGWYALAFEMDSPSWQVLGLSPFSPISQGTVIYPHVHTACFEMLVEHVSVSLSHGGEQQFPEAHKS